MGIGASAGGLEAFKRFFKSMPADSGMTFVLIPHLDPKHDSLMVELVARQTAMTVVEAAEGQPLESNHVYIIPPNKFLAIAEGRLHLTSPPEPRGRRTALDTFFCSLAEEQQERSIGIVLSGTGSHGTLGIKEIKLAGGMAMVQQPESADYKQMPESAIATGLVDYVLTPEQMPEALLNYVRQPYREQFTVRRVVAGCAQSSAGAGEGAHTLRLSLLPQEHAAAPRPAADGALACGKNECLSRIAARVTATRSSPCTKTC